jgi:hypothetical protein
MPSVKNFGLRPHYYQRHDEAGGSFRLLPHNIFIVPSVNEGIDSTCIVASKQDSTFDSFPEEKVAGLGQKFFFFAVSLDK